MALIDFLDKTQLSGEKGLILAYNFRFQRGYGLSCWGRHGSRIVRLDWQSGSGVIMLHPHVGNWAQENRKWDHATKPPSLPQGCTFSTSSRFHSLPKLTALNGDPVLKPKSLWGTFLFKFTHREGRGEREMYRNSDRIIGQSKKPPVMQKRKQPSLKNICVRCSAQERSVSRCDSSLQVFWGLLF